MAGLENPLWTQLQKVELTKDGTLRAPVSADGEDGIVIGDPPLRVPPPAEQKRGFLARFFGRR
jgi:hypothetical protein